MRYVASMELSSSSGRAGYQGHVQPSSGDLAATREWRPAQSPAGQWSLKHPLRMSLSQQRDCLLGRDPASEGHDVMCFQKCFKLICCVVSKAGQHPSWHLHDIREVGLP